MESGNSDHHGDNLHRVLNNKQKMTAENPFSSEFFYSEFIHEGTSPRFEPNEADKFVRSSSLLGNSSSLLSTPQSSLVLPNSPFDYQHDFSNHYGDSSSCVNRNRDDFDEILRQMLNGSHSDVQLPNPLAGHKDEVGVDQAMFDQIFTSAFEGMNLGDRIASYSNCHVSEQASCSRTFSLDRMKDKRIAGDDQQPIEANGPALELVNSQVCHPISQQQYYMDATFREPWYGHSSFWDEENYTSQPQQYYMDATLREPWYGDSSFWDEENYTSQPQHLYMQQFQNQSLEHVRGSRSFLPAYSSYESAQGYANYYDIADMVNRNYNSSTALCEYSRLSNSFLFPRQLEPSSAYDQCSNFVFPRRGNMLTSNFEDRYMPDSFDNSFGELRTSENAPISLVFPEGCHEEHNEMFPYMIDKCVRLMTNSSCSSQVQDFVMKCNEEQLTQLVEKISRTGFGLLKLCCHHHATRAVQKIIEELRCDEQYLMIEVALKPHVVALIKDSNGSHVAQCCFKFPPEYREPLFEAAVVNCVELARDGQGCCVLQKYIDVVQGDHKLILLTVLSSNALYLSQDPSGNYVVQHILKQRISWATDEILHQLKGKHAFLSLQKAASHVVEKCLTTTTGERQASILMELIGDPGILLEISQHKYGNYVIQKARKRCPGELLGAFRDAIRNVAPALCSNPYGRKVLASMNSMNSKE